VYNPLVARFAIALIVGVLTFTASGVSSLAVAEPCSGYEQAGQADDQGGCPPTCVTCGCCALAVEAVTMAVADAPEIPLPVLIAVLPAIPNADPRDILHVPKPPLA
jgi:hypothetical protein